LTDAVLLILRILPFQKRITSLLGQSAIAVVPKVGGNAPLGAVRNTRGAVKQKWAIVRRWSRNGR